MKTIVVLALFAAATARAGEGVHRLLETHARNKQQVLEQLQRMPQSALTERFGTDLRGAWRRMLLDGPCDGMDKETLLIRTLGKSDGTSDALDGALKSLQESHRRLFGHGANPDLMVRCAGDPAFRPFGRHMTLPEAMAELTADNGAETHAFQTIFETGRNTRGYVHKLECHSQATEFIYAITDIVYGVMLPADLEFADERVTANPDRVQLFHVRAGEVIALHPYILHSGSFSVEPDRTFAILIYKRPLAGGEQSVPLPHAWNEKQDCIRIDGVDKFYLTLEELHADDLKSNCGFIAGKEPLRLPDWK